MPEELELMGQQDRRDVLAVAVADPEPEPFSPSIFLDLPPTPSRPDCHNEDLASSDDLVLPFISRMLMEDDIDDAFFYKYPDHPTLLQAQQPFANILSDATPPDRPVEPLSQSQLLLQQFPADGDDLQVFFSGCNGDMLNIALLKGMEEGSRFLSLPTNNGLLNSKKQPIQVNTGGKLKNRRRTLQQDEDEPDEAETSRNSKLMVPEPEETGEMVDQIALNVFSWCLSEIQSLRLTIGGEQVENNTRTGTESRSKTNKKNGKYWAHETMDLHTMLLHCAQAVGMNDRRSATQLLGQIRKRSSPSGDANQRLAHCFAQGLEARLAGTGSQLYRSLVSRRTSVLEYLKAYQLFVEACCFKTMAFRFSNLTICHATLGRNKLHIVDYGIEYGLQWPTLLTRLATREGGPPEVRMTGIDLPQPGFRPSSRIEQTGRRLSSRASQLGVPFKFRSIAAARWETIRVDDLDMEPDEVLVVNSLVPFGHLMEDGVTVDSPSPRDVVLNNIQKMRPDVFILCIVNASYNSPFFVTRFREALSYYSAIYDMLDATTPRDNELRLLVERDLYGQCALNVVACEGLDRVERPERYKQWQARNHRAGLSQLPLDPCIVKDVREWVKSLYHKDFVIDIDQHWLLQGWKGRILYAMSTWVACK
ncbi:unnamed protein product [Miscanthus lutarioriparius]|uniref:Scarecrow-like protein 9 n=1 Tax=Miscanthus lutarioriparius TaxID=422564 RepID=A0A811Q9A7_9POAL|nr:unnamed protein product [Miscanthus lutarioriparius]